MFLNNSIHLRYLSIFALAAVFAAGTQDWRLERGVVPVKVDAAVWDMSSGDGRDEYD